MQPLAAPPRDGFTAAQVTAALVAPDPIFSFGVELLDASLTVVSDITADMAGGTVHRNNTAAVHGTVDLSISRELAWGRDRVRPYMLVSSASAGVSGCRFNLGVYLLTTPVTPLAETPVTYTVTGFDQLYLLQSYVGDSYALAAGAPVLSSVRAALTAAGITAPVVLDTTAASAVLAAPMTFPMTSSGSASWLTIVNRLLKAIVYRPIWVDENGTFRSDPYIDPADRPEEWVFSVGDPTSGIVADDRKVESDVWSAPNWWRVVRNGLTVAPVEGTGQYTTENLATGPSSQASIGRLVPAQVAFLDAVDQPSLVAQGDALKAAAMRTTETITAQISPFPLAWHEDIAAYSDPGPGLDRKVMCRSWDLPLDGSDMTYEMGSVLP